MNFDFLGLKKSISQVQDRLDQVRLEKSSLHNQMSNLRYAPAGPADIKAAVTQWVEESAQAYWSEFRASVTAAAKESVPTKGVSLKPLATLGAHGGRETVAMSREQMGQALCAMLAPHILNVLCEQIDAMQWPANAVAIADRDGEMSRLNGLYAQLSKEEEALVKSAHEAGLTV